MLALTLRVVLVLLCATAVFCPFALYIQTMGTKGVQRIQTAEGDDFDPNLMEAMSTMPCPGGEAKPGAIANVWQVR